MPIPPTSLPPPLLLLLLLPLWLGLSAAAELSFVDSVKRQLEEAQGLVGELELPRAVEQNAQDEEAVQAAEHFEFEYLPASEEQLLEPVSSASHDEHHHPKVGYSVGGPLVNIAQGAAAQAHTFEKNQPAAAAQAAYVAKNRLGQSAGLSAATAAAAFAGKQIIYRGLQQQAYNAHRALESEKLQLQQAQRAATTAAHAAQQAAHQLQVITTALNAAQATSQHASAAAAAAAAELAAQTAMVGAAKTRLQTIEEQLHLARIDFEAAQAANFKAAHAARVAQNNAAAAAAHAAEVAGASHHDDDDHHHHHHGQHHGHHHGHQREHHEHHKHHSEKLEEAEEGGPEEEEGQHESVARPVASDAPPEKLGRAAQQAAPPDYPGAPPAAPLAAISKDELYDAYDSFPY